jgi:hypothetical protein
MIELFVRLSAWIRNTAVRRAYALGDKAIDEFRRHHPHLLANARAEGKEVLGFYECPNGAVDSNYHLFDNIYEAAEWAVSPAGLRAKRLFYLPCTLPALKRKRDAEL